MANLSDEIKSRGFKPQVLTKQVSDLLTDLILKGTLTPGEQLVENELQKQLGISRSPLREAFRELEKKGLVEIIPRKGTFVRAITRKDIEENFPVRACLEGLAAREAYAKITPQELAQMGAALKEMKKAAEHNDVEKYWETHFEFHETFIRASGNQLLRGILSTLRMHRLWYVVTYRYQWQNIHMSIDIHKQIHDMLSAEDTDLAKLETLVRKHIQDALESLFGSEDLPQARVK